MIIYATVLNAKLLLLMKGWMMASEILRYSKLTDNEIQFYRGAGYLTLPGLIGQDDAAALAEEVLQVIEGLGIKREDLRRATTSKDKLRQSRQYLAQWTLARLIHSEGLRAIAAQLMGGPSTLYMPFTAVKSGGGGGRFHFHQDNQYTRFDGPGINIWFALMEMSPENGCLQIAPATHLHGTLDSVESEDKDGHRTVAVEPQDFLPLRMMPGDAVAFSRLTLHGSGANSTDQPRLGYAVQFHRDDVRAKRDGEDLGLLKENPRYVIAPVNEISPGNE
ncbi:MAG: phytanoyl-CoA dioxygenase family protein [Chloroflexi bacterium]|nr:phytanoyl-CoA dioxygenase family protein [Chloroflexota bacterium]